MTTYFQFRSVCVCVCVTKGAFEASNFSLINKQKNQVSFQFSLTLIMIHKYLVSSSISLIGRPLSLISLL